MTTFRKVYSFAADGKKYMFKAIFLLTCSAAFSIIPYYMVYLMILQITSGTLVPSFCFITALTILAAMVLKNITNEYGLKASHRLAYDTLMGMRRQASDKLLKMPMGEIDKYGSAELKKVFVENIESMELVLAHGIPEGVSNIIGIIVATLAIFLADWRLALCSLIVLPIGFIIIMMMGRNATAKLENYYQASKKMNNSIIEYIRGMEVIKVFTRRDTSFAQYRSSIQEYKRFSLEWYRSCWKYMSMYNVVLPSTLLFVLPAGIFFYLDGTLTFPMLVFCILLAFAIGPMLIKLVSFFPIIPGLKQKFKRIEKLYQEPEMSSGTLTGKPASHTIEFDDVTFAYIGVNVIKRLCFKAQEGKVTALVGESGAGKSTVAKLIVRFWDVDGGQILLGGRNIKDYSFDTLMDCVSYVSQDNFLFDTTIMENIRHGSPLATDEEVMEMAKKSRCHDFIMEMGEGYQTFVGEAGDRLSGGQRQRITIARAMLKNAPVIILDEATSSTDAENEDFIQAALNELLVGKTVLVIAHRLSTITEADNIIVLNQGEIAGQGRHEELLGSCAGYTSMWHNYKQSASWEYGTVKEGY